MRWLPLVTGIIFVSTFVALVVDPQRALVLAMLFVGCVIDPSSRE